MFDVVIGLTFQVIECALKETKKMKNSFMIVLAFAIFILVGCGSSDSEKADSIEDTVGTWRRVRVDGASGGEGYCRLFEDGTYHCDSNLERVSGNSPAFMGEHWFEGTQLFDQMTEGAPPLCTEVGVYEVHLQPNGNLKYELVEDECRDRITAVVGRGAEEGLIEWERVP